MHRYALLLPLLAGWTPLASAYSESGSVTAIGSIIQNTCSINTDSIDQTVIMHTRAVSDIIRDGEGPAQPFFINLSDCPSDALTRYQVTFNGDSDGLNFDLAGQAQGVALQISDAFGNIAKPGIAMPEQALSGEQPSLEFLLTLTGNERALRAGDYRALLRFSMEYF